MPRWQRIVAAAAWGAWLVAWGWALGPAYSNGFFQYDRLTRIPVWASNLAAVAVATWALARTWRALGRRPAAWPGLLLRQALASAAAWGVAWAVVVVLVRLPAPLHLEADDSLGAGIDLMLTLAWGTLAVVLGALRALAVQRAAHPPAGDAEGRP